MAAASETEVWAGTYDGLGYSTDSGATWQAIDLSPRTRPLDLPAAFAFPSPYDFSADNVGPLTFRYALAAPAVVTLEVYDFAGRLVKRVVDNQPRPAGDRIDETWDGRRDDGANAANGVYFFVIKTGGAVAATGKFVILD
jgi:hypothetical protein